MWSVAELCTTRIGSTYSCRHLYQANPNVVQQGGDPVNQWIRRSCARNRVSARGIRRHALRPLTPHMQKLAAMMPYTFEPQLSPLYSLCVPHRCRRNATYACQVMVDVLRSLPTTAPPSPSPPVPSSTIASLFPPAQIQSPPGSGGGGGGDDPAVRALRQWLCATFLPILAGRPSAVRAFLDYGGVAVLCRELETGPADIASHACGVLECVLRGDGNNRLSLGHGSGIGGSGGGGLWPDVRGAAIDAVEVSCTALFCEGGSRGLDSWCQ